jgi:hypothetical protein
MTQVDDINAAITALQTVAAETPGTISWQCEELAKRLAKYVRTDSSEEEELKSKAKKSRK